MKLKKMICLAAVLSLLAVSTAGCASTGHSETQTVTEKNFAADKAGDTVPEGKKAADAAEIAPEGEAAPALKDDAAKSTAKSEDRAILNGMTEAAAVSEGDAVTDFEGTEAAKSPEGVIAYEGEVIGEAKGEKKIEPTEPMDPAEPITEESPAVIEEPYEVPEAGLLTAGEWNDNLNWGFFSNLVNSQKINFPSFGLDPRYRTMVTVKNDKNQNIANAKARLLDKEGNILWSGMTDKNGVVYLFGTGVNADSVEIESGNVKQNFKLEVSSVDEQGNIKTAENSLEVKLNTENQLYPNTEIMFLIDATGSMTDELVFLQSEFTEIAKETGTQNTKFAVHFYRDHGDDYVTKNYDFTNNISELQQKINSESASGGGDFPEAVAEALDEAVFQSSWSDDSVKLVFMIFDAPPHEQTEEKIQKAVKEAAVRGIHIIPVIASDSDRETELFGRALAIVTGGTYVFLTDDSGIGNSHLEPIIGSYETEKLYDIIIRLIHQYQQ